MSPVVQIIAAEAVHYSVNNGITMLEYDPGEYYEVPDHVARGMLARGWAQLATGDPGERTVPQPEPAPPPVQEPHQQPAPKPEEENGDDGEHHDHDDGADARQALRTKGKRR